ncbi:MAG TPA: diguanylate cyclase [Myxococcales bacterium]|nr:diguanylate cyclase [Myxococcales bacterium]
MDLAGDEAFELKLIFLRELAAGHASARAAMERLEKTPSDQAAVAELRALFHKVAGNAAVVDLALLGRLAAACETVADGLLESKGEADWRALQVFSEGLAGVAAVVEGDVKPGSFPPPAGALAPQELPLPHAGPARVLVVDDDPFSARLVDSVLRTAGFQSSFVTDPAKAFDTILRETPDLIILDVVMPGMDGFRLCQRVRAHPGLQVTPIVFVTRKGDVEQRVRGLQVGGNDYVAKPFEPQELVARVRSHIKSLADLRELAIRDGLTRCFNNKFFKMRLEQEVARAQRYQTELTLGMLDVDHFKRINDGYGHPAGDAVLSHLASILTASVRSTDVVARYGGEEFGFLLVEAGAPEAEIITNRLRERVAAHRFEVPAVDGDMLTLSCTVSIGLASFKPNDTHHTLLQRADGALYEAKNTGRNRVWVAP